MVLVGSMLAAARGLELALLRCRQHPHWPAELRQGGANQVPESGQHLRGSTLEAPTHSGRTTVCQQRQQLAASRIVLGLPNHTARDRTPCGIAATHRRSRHSWAAAPAWSPAWPAPCAAQTAPSWRPRARSASAAAPAGWPPPPRRPTAAQSCRWLPGPARRAARPRGGAPRPRAPPGEGAGGGLLIRVLEINKLGRCGSARARAGQHGSAQRRAGRGGQQQAPPAVPPGAYRATQRQCGCCSCLQRRRAWPAARPCPAGDKVLPWKLLSKCTRYIFLLPSNHRLTSTFRPPV